MQNRYYNPDWGRFLNEDTIAAVTGDVLSTNMYAYCVNNPANMSDANGDRPVCDNEDEVEEYYKLRMSARDKQREENPMRSSDAKKREEEHYLLSVLLVKM